MERASRARKVSEGRKTSPPMKPMSPIKTVKEKSPSRSTKSKSATRKKSPGRSRSRSAARKKALNKLEDVKDVPQNYVNSVKQTKEAKSVSPTKSFLAVSNAKDAVESKWIFLLAEQFSLNYIPIVMNISTCDNYIQYT